MEKLSFDKIQISICYKEIGRAGRDGLSSECTVLWNHADFNQARYFLNKDIKSSTLRNAKAKKIETMENYLESKTCRREALLRYFS